MQKQIKTVTTVKEHNEKEDATLIIMFIKIYSINLFLNPETQPTFSLQLSNTISNCINITEQYVLIGCDIIFPPLERSHAGRRLSTISGGLAKSTHT